MLDQLRWVTPVAAGVLAALTACNREDAHGRDPDDAGIGAALHPVEIHVPESLRAIGTDRTDVRGRTVGIACMTCHAGRTEPHTLPASAADLGGPHAGLVVAHGTNTCASCHDPASADRLRLADGTSLPMTEALRLCAQCHGPQHRDYQRGSHGGMNGYWDLRRGPRVKNHCVDCHDPHAPAYPRVRPMPPPGDRFIRRGPEARHE